MKIRRAVTVLGATVLLVAAVATGGRAQDASPSPVPSPSAAASAAPAPALIGFTARAHANATFVMANATYNGVVTLGLAQRANLIRVDLLSFKADALPIPPVSATFIIDRGTNTVTVWSEATKKYRVQSFLPKMVAPRTPSPHPTTPPPVSIGPSPFAKLDVLEATLKLTGHTTTLGFPTTGFAFDLQVANQGDKATSHVTATTQLADEFSLFPLTLDLAIEPGTAPFSAKIAYAVDDLTRNPPPLARFRVPAGYTRAPDLMSVLIPRRP